MSAGDLIRKFKGEPVNVEIDGLTVGITPLRWEDLDLLFKLKALSKENPTEKELSESKEIIRKIVFKALQPSLPNLTLEDVSKFSVGYLMKIFTKVLEVSGLVEKGFLSKVMKEGE